MSVFYIPNPENPQAVKLIGVDGRAPDRRYIDSKWSIIMAPIVTVGAILWAVWGEKVMAWIFGVLAFLYWLFALADFEPILRSRYRRFKKLLASGEIIEVPRDVLFEYSTLIGRNVSQKEHDELLRESFNEIKRLVDDLRVGDARGALEDEVGRRLRKQFIQTELRGLIEAFQLERDTDKEANLTWLRSHFKGELENG